MNGVNLHGRDRCRWSPNLPDPERRGKTTLGVGSEMGSSLLEALKCRRWSSMNHLDRVVVFSSTVSATFIALLFEGFLRLGIGETEQEFDAILALNVMKFTDDGFSIIAGFETMEKK